MEMSDGSQEGSQFALLPYSRPDWGWREIGGDFIVDGRGTWVGENERETGG